MLLKETWSRQCDCAGKLVWENWIFFSYAVLVVRIWITGDSGIEAHIEFLPVISSEFGLNVFYVALGIVCCLVMYFGAYVTEFRCDASGHGDSSDGNDVE